MNKHFCGLLFLTILLSPLIGFTKTIEPEPHYIDRSMSAKEIGVCLTEDSLAELEKLIQKSKTDHSEKISGIVSLSMENGNCILHFTHIESLNGELAKKFIKNWGNKEALIKIYEDNIPLLCELYGYEEIKFRKQYQKIKEKGKWEQFVQIEIEDFIRGYSQLIAYIPREKIINALNSRQAPGDLLGMFSTYTDEFYRISSFDIEESKIMRNFNIVDNPTSIIIYEFFGGTVHGKIEIQKTTY